MGGKKRDEAEEVRDTVSEISENRSNGNDAEPFSAPMGFIPRFPGPPKYIKVKAQNRRGRDFDRLFLAQILLDNQKSNGRKFSIDSKIHSIDDAPAVQSPTTAKTPNNAVWAMEFSKDGRYLAAAGQDKKLRVWEVVSVQAERDSGDHEAAQEEGKEDFKLNAPFFKQKLVREYDGHTSSILDLSWSKNNFLLSSSMDKTVRLYHVSRAECLCAFKHNDFVTSIQFHPRDDRFFLAGSLDSKIRLWSIPDKNVAYWQQVPDMVTAVAFTPDGKTAIAGTLGGLCILYDTEGLKAHSQIHVKSARGKNSKGSKVTGIDTIAIQRENGQSDVKILITSNDSRIRMYNLKDRNLEIKFRGNENSCSQIHATFSDDGKFVICGSEDRKVYIWPTGPYERSDTDKRPVEVFEAHSAIVTSAILVPTKSRRLLAQSGDPIYDLCNPPPVTLLSRADSMYSSKAPTQRSNGSNDEKRASISPSQKSGSPRRATESPTYLARHTHNGGYVVVTADYTGQIKVFRQDCAYHKRRQESWDEAGSSFSRKMLARSGSVMTRNSVASSNVHRQSLTFASQQSPSMASVGGSTHSKNGSSERILSWRNSVGTGGNGPNSATASETNFSFNRATVMGQNDSAGDRARSVSPGTGGWKKRLSIRRDSPLKDEKAGKRASVAPTIEVTPETPAQGPGSPGTFHSARDSRHNSIAQQQNIPPTLSQAGLNIAQPGLPRKVSTDSKGVPKHPISDQSNPLFLSDGQSMMAWNVENTLMPMAQHVARTPGLRGPDGNPLSRNNSIVSELSSEAMSSEVEEPTGYERRDSLGSGGPSVGSGGSGQAGGGDLKCGNCGSTSFRAMDGTKGRKLRCKRCGTVV